MEDGFSGPGLPSGGKLDFCVLALGEDTEGEIYVLTGKIANMAGKNGKVYKLVPTAD